MNKIINILIILLLLPHPSLAAPPINYNQEIASDTALRGSLFTDASSAGMYAWVDDNGQIHITSTIHQTKTIKFKGTALINRLKMYNGLTVGVTHIADDGTITHEIMPLVIDFQGFAYGTFSFSETIISGLTATTVYSETNLSGNYTKNFVEVNVTSVDLSITNNAGYVINGSSFAKYRPITINHSGALSAYQLMLNITDDPIDMQADFDDIRFVYQNGTEIPYWIEYIDFSEYANIWIKADLVDGNTTINMYYGNASVSSVSNITNTMIFGDDFSGDLSKWSGDTASFGTSGGELTHTPGTSSKKIYANTGGSLVDTIIESRIKTTDSSIDFLFGITYRISATERGAFSRRDYTGYERRWGDGSTYYSTVPPQWTSGTYGIDRVRVASTVATSIHSFDGETVTGVTKYGSDSLGTNVGLMTYGTGTPGVQYVDYIFVRKYTEIDPSYIIGDEQVANNYISVSVTGDQNNQLYNVSQTRNFTLTPTANISQIVFNTTSTDYSYTATLYWVNNVEVTESFEGHYYHIDFIANFSLNTTNGYINYTPQDYKSFSPSFINFIEIETDDNDFNISRSNVDINGYQQISLYTEAFADEYHYNLTYYYFTYPENFTVADNNTTYVNTTWDAMVFADIYELRKGGVFESNTTNTYYNFTNLTPCTEYEFEVMAWNGTHQASKNLTVSTVCEEPIVVEDNEKYLLLPIFILFGFILSLLIVYAFNIKDNIWYTDLLASMSSAIISLTLAFYALIGISSESILQNRTVIGDNIIISDILQLEVIQSKILMLICITSGIIMLLVSIIKILDIVRGTQNDN